jgi:hypothetical protein
MTAVPLDPPPAPIPDYQPVGLWVSEDTPVWTPPVDDEPAPAPGPAPEPPSVVVVEEPARKPIKRKASPAPLDPDLAYRAGAVKTYLSTLSPAERAAVLNDVRTS